MPHQPRFDWQLWFSALSTYETEYYLIHFLYKVLNNDTTARSLIKHDPFEGTAPKYLRVELDHYQFTDFKKEKVTFGLKGLLTRLPFVLNLLPTDLQRYFRNDRVVEKLIPDNWWRRSDSP